MLYYLLPTSALLSLVLVTLLATWSNTIPIRPDILICSQTYGVSMFPDRCRRKLLSRPDAEFTKMSLPIAGRHKVPMRFGNPNHYGKPRKFHQLLPSLTSENGLRLCRRETGGSKS